MGMVWSRYIVVAARTWTSASRHFGGKEARVSSLSSCFFPLFLWGERKRIRRRGGGGLFSPCVWGSVCVWWEAAGRETWRERERSKRMKSVLSNQLVVVWLLLSSSLFLLWFVGSVAGCFFLLFLLLLRSSGYDKKAHTRTSYTHHMSPTAVSFLPYVCTHALHLPLLNPLPPPPTHYTHASLLSPPPPPPYSTPPIHPLLRSPSLCAPTELEDHVDGAPRHHVVEGEGLVVRPVRCIGRWVGEVRWVREDEGR